MGVLVELEVAARALELHALERGDERVLVRSVSLGRLKRELERGHAVPRLEREDVGQEVVLLLVGVDEGLVLGVVERDRPEERRDRTVRLLLHFPEDVLLGEEARAVHPEARGGHAELVPRLDVVDRVGAREERVNVLRRLRLELRDERQEVRGR